MPLPIAESAMAHTPWTGRNPASPFGLYGLS